MAAQPNPQPSPTELMRQAVPRMTADELVEFAQDFFEELASRAYTYAMVAEEGAPREAVMAGFAYASAVKDLIPHNGHASRVTAAWHSTLSSVRDLENALYRTKAATHAS